MRVEDNAMCVEDTRQQWLNRLCVRLSPIFACIDVTIEPIQFPHELIDASTCTPPILLLGLCDSLAHCFSLRDRVSPTVKFSLVCDKRPESLGTALTRVDVFFRMMHNQALQTSKVMVEVKLVDAPE